MLGGPWALKPPGWSLKPPPGRPGRKRDEYDESLDDELRVGADYLKESLQARLLRRAERESENQRIRRVAALVRQVWEKSPFAQGLDDPQPKELGVSVDDTGIRWKEIPPPPENEVMKWVREAFERRTETGRSIQSRLTWKMLGYRYELREDQVRGRLEALRKFSR